MTHFGLNLGGVQVSAFDVPGFQLQPVPEPPVDKLMMMSVKSVRCGTEDTNLLNDTYCAIWNERTKHIII